MNFFQNLVTELKGPLGAFNHQELTVIGPALASILPAAVLNPTKAGLIAAATPAIAKIAVAQPSLLVELITDLVAAVGQIPAAPSLVQQQPAGSLQQAAASKVG
jgi:hypothetical protein